MAYDELPSLDRYLLASLDEFVAESKAAYDGYQFQRVYSLLQQFAVSDLSNFYLDIAKDRLYISAPDDPRRRSCQTVTAHPRQPHTRIQYIYIYIRTAIRADSCQT